MRPKSRYRTMSPAAAVAIRELYFVGRLKQDALARMFGIRQGSVSRIVSGRIWDRP